MSRDATPAEFRAAAERVLAHHADLFKALAIRDHHIYDRAIALGFVERPHVPELSDQPISELVYLYRERIFMPPDGIALAQAFTQHQYLSLCHFEGRFTEAVVEVYHVARNPKGKRGGKESEQQKRGVRPLYTNIARDWETLEAMVGRTYELARD